MQRQPAHSKASGRRWPIVVAIVSALTIVGGGAGAFVWIARSNPTKANVAPPRAVLPFNVVTTTPAANAQSIASASTITVTFSAPIGQNSPMPTLAPQVPGAWSLVSPSEVEFVASAPLVPGATESVLIPGGAGGMVSSQGVHLASSSTVPFSVATGSILRLQQLLAQLGYLPVTFTPIAPMTSPTQVADVQQGTFGWRWANQPTSLTSLWTPGQMNVITKGAIMDFQDQHNLKTDGAPGPQVWTDLLNDASTGHPDANPYRYVVVSENNPETVTVYQNGVVDYNTLANTGVPGADTEKGTFTVFERYVTTTMTGTNVDGSHYSDPGIPWVSYFNGGDALHGFDRGGYGYPQSNGCVEMPPSNAAVVYPLTPIGTLVTVV
jgi:peptidoglycan hydrolase-like protein with peptidoglycan-binding domain